MYKKTGLVLIGLLVQWSLFAQYPFEIKYGPYLQNMGENEVTVVWVTNQQALGWVELAPDDETHFYAEERPQFFQTENGRKLVGTLHRVTIKGLKKGTRYRYRVYSREVLDNTGWDTSFGRIAATNPNRLFAFTTLDRSKEAFHFAVVNDIHARSEFLDSLISGIKLDQQDFIFFNGDMMSHLNSEELMFDGFLNKSTELFASNIPFFYARGNHETRGPFSTRFMDYFPTPTGKPYYTFRHGPALFIVLDGGEDKPDSDIEYGGLSAFDPYRKEQAEWLKTVVASEEFKNATVKIVVIHVPPFTSTWHGTLQVGELFVPILNRAGVDLMLCGHTHRYSLQAKGKNGNNFPILTNSNQEIVEVAVDGKNIEVTLKDKTGKQTRQFSF
ncbi:metallophosphoesterase family protein [Parabacteroides sp. PF5-6]|uniref:purple acid phosphatase family protein n=1 Tax=Parabacteroides sp. PF5-6 TaxID=1742403 RepID=UPI00240503DE|nr:metallophosphoesterase family protein [Parabacteroides sp. PF5-6]MDF9830806.1 putative phosphodiesterase [Parabacteroides sp. PF5-6]